jgi:hypothetical protein
MRFARPVALGRKVSDEYTVPLCRSHHRELHRASREKRWWERLGIDPIPTAARLWAETHLTRTLPQDDAAGSIRNDIARIESSGDGNADGASQPDAGIPGERSASL